MEDVLEHCCCMRPDRHTLQLLTGGAVCSQHSLCRDVFNEKPAADDILAAEEAGDGPGELPRSMVMHTTKVSSCGTMICVSAGPIRRGYSMYRLPLMHIREAQAPESAGQGCASCRAAWACTQPRSVLVASLLLVALAQYSNSTKALAAQRECLSCTNGRLSRIGRGCWDSQASCCAAWSCTPRCELPLCTRHRHCAAWQQRASSLMCCWVHVV